MAPIIAAAPFIGSFLGVLIRRIPDSQPFMMGRSRCETCQAVLKPLEMVPILSHLRQRGRCRQCKTIIDPFHLRVELAAFGIPLSLLVALWLQDGQNVSLSRLWLDSALGWTLLALAWIDMHCLRLPDILTMPLLLLGLMDGVLTGKALDAAFTPTAPSVTAWTPENTLPDRLLGCVCGWGLLAGVSLLHRLIRKRNGLGAGDAKLLAAGGAWLGLAALPNVILLAALIGIAHCAAQKKWARSGEVPGSSWETPIPFGPGLAAAIWLMRLISP